MNLAVIRAARRLVLLASLTLVVFAVLMGAHQATASAQVVADPDYWKGTSERQATVYRFVYDQSPQTIPAGYDPVREAEQILAQQQRTLAPSNPQARSLWQQIRTLSARARLAPALRALGTVGLVVGTFELGWKIGTGINTKFLKIGIPEGGPTGAQASYARWTSLKWKAANNDSFFGATWPQTEGWVGQFTNYWQTSTNRWFDAPCEFSGITPPAPLVTMGPLGTSTECLVLGQPNAPVRLRYAFLPENDLGAVGPIEDYTGQPYTATTPAPRMSRPSWNFVTAV